MAQTRFFASLPAQELAPWEADLRKGLLAALNAGLTNFPLTDWIDRRIGGEIETLRSGREIRIRDGDANGGRREQRQQQDGPEPAEFFASLSPDSFQPPEEALRDTLMEFLAKWSSPELASLSQVVSDPQVKQKIKEFLPRKVTLRDWIEHRIGGELEFKPGKTGQEVISLTPAGQRSVMQKFQAIAMNGIMAQQQRVGAPMGQSPNMQRQQPIDQANYRSQQKPAAQAPKDKQQEAEDFINSLPADELLPAEVELRQAMLDWIPRWPSIRPANKSGLPATIADMAADLAVKRARKSMQMPEQMRLADWIERRIGGEIFIRPFGKDGNKEVSLSSDFDGMPQNSGRKRSRERSNMRSDHRGSNRVGSGLATRDSRDTDQRQPNRADRTAADFFASLPADEFSPAEESLRSALIDFLNRHPVNSPPTLGDANNDPQVSACRRDLFPRGSNVNMADWINRRIGGEIETRQGSGGNTIFGFRGQMDRGQIKRRR